MIDFEKLFVENKGKPISVNGTEYCMVLKINSESHCGIHLKLFDCITHPKQGIRFDCDQPLSNEGDTSNAFVFWKGSDKCEFDLQCPNNADIAIRNVWDYGDGVEQSWHAGGAMVVEQDERTIRIRANSTLQNDRCEDLHCELTWLDEPPAKPSKRGLLQRLFGS